MGGPIGWAGRKVIRSTVMETFTAKTVHTVSDAVSDSPYSKVGDKQPVK